MLTLLAWVTCGFARTLVVLVGLSKTKKNNLFIINFYNVETPVRLSEPFAIVYCESGKILVFLQRTDIKTTKKSVFPIVLRHS